MSPNDNLHRPDHWPYLPGPAMAVVTVEKVAAERDRYRDALERIIVNLDGQSDGNIWPKAALRIAREALPASGASEQSDSCEGDV